MNNTLSIAERAMLAFWHDYVRSYSPDARRYNPEVHTLNRTRLFYLMTEDLIAYLDKCDMPRATGQALALMQVSSATLAEWRKKWWRTWLDLHFSQP